MNQLSFPRFNFAVGVTNFVATGSPVKDRSLTHISFYRQLSGLSYELFHSSCRRDFTKLQRMKGRLGARGKWRVDRNGMSTPHFLFCSAAAEKEAIQLGVIFKHFWLVKPAFFRNNKVLC